ITNPLMVSAGKHRGATCFFLCLSMNKGTDGCAFLTRAGPCSEFIGVGPSYDRLNVLLDRRRWVECWRLLCTAARQSRSGTGSGARAAGFSRSILLFGLSWQTAFERTRDPRDEPPGVNSNLPDLTIECATLCVWYLSHARGVDVSCCAPIYQSPVHRF
ncbi:hypothetical protein FB45DRAFT_909258, partial [Roridomyces roridus]